MGYYDGNTVTGLWNYAQQYAMSDNSYGTTYGPSSVGAINLITGQTHGFSADGEAVPAATGTMIGDPQPAGDKCNSRDSSTSTDPKNQNIGDLLNAKGVSWGWFQGGFADCTAKHSDPRRGERVPTTSRTTSRSSTTRAPRTCSTSARLRSRRSGTTAPRTTSTT